MAEEYGAVLAPGHGLRAAREHTAAIDEVVASLLPQLQAGLGAVTAVALGRYGRRELTPGSSVDLLMLHAGHGSPNAVADSVVVPLWERGILHRHTVWTPSEAAVSARREVSTATRLLDARLITGDAALFGELMQCVAGRNGHDRDWLRRHLGDEVQGRHAAHASVASASMPDLERGRGGLRDLEVLRWLDREHDERLNDALDFFLRLRTALETLLGDVPERLSLVTQDRVAPALGYPSEVAGGDALMADLYRHARWVAFCLDSTLAPARRDRRLRLGLEIHEGQLVGERLPPIEWVPALGLRVASLVGFAPPSRDLLRWASAPGPALPWDRAMLDQLFRLLQVADPRAWEFLDVTSLLLRYMPEWAGHCRRSSTDHSLAADRRGFQLLRRLHDNAEKGDDSAGARAWHGLRHRSWLDMAALLSELAQETVAGSRVVQHLCERLGLPSQACTTIGFLVEQRQLLANVARSRDIHDEELILETTSRVGSRQRLDMLYLLTLADDLATEKRAPAGWKTELIAELYQLLVQALEQPLDLRGHHSLERHRREVVTELMARGREDLLPAVGHLPRRYLLARAPASVARHLALAGGEPLADGEVRIRADPHQQVEIWELLLVARDRPGLLATMAGVLALRGVSILAADVATCSDGLVLDVFAVTSAYGVPLEESLWPRVAEDLRAALDGQLPLEDLLAHGDPADSRPERAPAVRVNNSASQFYTVIDIRAPDGVGLLYRITRALHRLELDIHHAKIATSGTDVLDAFYVWDLTGAKLDESRAQSVARDLATELGGRQRPR